MEHLKKILVDSLTNVDGQYSSKKITMFVAFIVCIIQAFLDQLTSYKLNPETFFAFVGMSGGMAGLSTWYNNKVTQSGLPSQTENIESVTVEKR